MGWKELTSGLSVPTNGAMADSAAIFWGAMTTASRGTLWDRKELA